jgi:hypothetical protein
LSFFYILSFWGITLTFNKVEISAFALEAEEKPEILRFWRESFVLLEGSQKMSSPPSDKGAIKMTFLGRQIVKA